MCPPPKDKNRNYVVDKEYYSLLTERYLEGTKRFHEVTNYFLVAEALLFSFLSEAPKLPYRLVQAVFPSVGFAFSTIWLLILFRIEHMRDMRKRQGKQLENHMQETYGTEFYLFRKEEYDIKEGKGSQSTSFLRVFQNLQVSHLAYGLPLLFSVAWGVILVSSLRTPILLNMDREVTSLERREACPFTNGIAHSPTANTAADRGKTQTEDGRGQVVPEPAPSESTSEGRTDLCQEVN